MNRSCLKGQCHEIFCFWFFINQFPPQSIPLGPFRIFLKIRGDISKSRCTTGVNDTGGKLPPVSMTPVSNLPPVSTTTIPAANLPPLSATPVANCHRYQRHRGQICRRCRWHRWQIMRTISGCRHLKVNLKAKIYILYMLTLLPKGAQTKLLKFFCLKIFSICHRCRWHRWCTLCREYLREFSKKIEMAVMVYSDAWGNWFMKKTRSRKSCDTVPLRRENGRLCSKTVQGYITGAPSLCA